MTKPVTLVFGLAAREARELEQDRVGTEHLLLGLAREGDGVAARALEDLGAGLLELREAVVSVYSAGADPEPLLPADRGRPAWEPPAGAHLERVLPLVSEHPLPSGDLLVLLSLEIWSDWFDLRYAIVYATPEPEGDLPRPSVLGRCEVSDRAGTSYVNWVSILPGLRHGPQSGSTPSCRRRRRAPRCSSCASTPPRPPPGRPAAGRQHRRPVGTPPP